MNTPTSRFQQTLFIATYVVILSYLLLNLQEVIKFISKGFDIISPFIVGMAIAFILNIPMHLFETHLFCLLDHTKNTSLQKLKRPFAILLTLFVVFGFLIVVILFMIPQLIESTATLIYAVPGYVKSLEDWVKQSIDTSEIFYTLSNEILSTWKDFVQVGSSLLANSLSSLLNMTLSFTTSVVNLGISLVLAIYMLSSKEKLITQTKKVIFAFLNKSTAHSLLSIGQIAHLAFYRFIGGQFTEALIIGSLCFIGMSLLSIPYPLLISVIIAITSLIPFFGAFIGIIPSVFIIFIIDPLKALWFVVFIIVLQQFEGNIIYPRVVGHSIGLSGLWVIFAMLIGGSSFGLLGMLLGIPVFSIIYQLFRNLVYHKLYQKKLKEL